MSENEKRKDLEHPLDQESQCKIKYHLPKPNNIILDIYGCTSSWSFIEHTLMPFIRNNLANFVSTHWKDQRLKRIIERCKNQTDIDRAAGIEVPLIKNSDNENEESIKKSVVDNIVWQMDNEHKANKGVLSILNDLIWQEGYTSGNLKAHVFSDVPAAFELWRMKQFIKLYSYASGASSGQKLFFKSTIKGDLTKYFNNYIDATGDKKKDSAKFEIVAKSLRDDPKNLLFFTDCPVEARAAMQAKINSIVVFREGNKEYSQHELEGLMCINSFDQVHFVEDPTNPSPCC